MIRRNKQVRHGKFTAFLESLYYEEETVSGKLLCHANVTYLESREGKGGGKHKVSCFSADASVTQVYLKVGAA
jgi:hypothetical protein